jgi:hypothetical protein
MPFHLSNFIAIALSQTLESMPIMNGILSLLNKKVCPSSASFFSLFLSHPLSLFPGPILSCHHSQLHTSYW